MGARIEPDPQSPPDSAASEPPHLHALSEATSAVQTESTGKRPLSGLELEAARKVFDSAINYPVVRLGKMGSFIELIIGSRAYTTGNLLNLPGKVYASPNQYLSIIIHELVHVWQYQHGGWGYVPKALWAQTVGDGYDFAKALRQGKPWTKMNPEQQAQMIQDAFKGLYFDFPGSLFGVLDDKGCVVRPNTKAPEGFANYTPALTDALAVLRKGA